MGRTKDSYIKIRKIEAVAEYKYLQQFISFEDHLDKEMK